MKIHIIKTDSDFSAIRSSWNSLTDQPFASWEWNYWWWKHLGQEHALRVVVGEVDGQVCAIAPLMIETRRGERKLRFLGTGKTCSDYLQIIAKPGIRDTFISALAEEIENGDDFRVRLVELEGVEASRDQAEFCRELSVGFWRYDREIDSAWIAELPDNWDEFVAGRHKSQRRKIRKAVKQIEAGVVVMESTREGLPFEKAYEQLAQLHQSRMVSMGRTGVFADPEFTRFLHDAARELCRRGLAEIVVATADGRPVVAHLYLHSPTGPQLYQSGMCEKSTHLAPGHMLFTYTVKRAIESGQQSFDFLRGNEKYKKLWGARPVPLFTIRCVSKNLTTTVTHQMMRGMRQLKRSFASFPVVGNRLAQSS